VSWEQRDGHGRYYTRSRRAHGRIVREYCGCGAAAALAATLDEADRAVRQARQAAYAEERKAVGAARSATAAFDSQVTLALLTGMKAKGYRLHARSEWRRTRMSKKPASDPAGILDAMAYDSGENVPSTAELWSFLHRETTPPDERPVGLVRRAEDAWICLLAGPDPAGQEAITAQLQEFRSGLGPDNSPLGRLLIDQLAVCWLEANYLSTRAAETASEDTTATHREFLFRGADRAHRRLAFLLKQLTTVRNLLRSASRVDGTTNSNAATPAAAVSTPPCGRKRRDKSR